jgi:microcystin degradation protein MlrC
VTDGDADGARALTERLLDAAWARRADFIYRGEPLAEALDRAATLNEGPIVLLDHADNCGSGGTQDVMTVIAAVIAKGLEDVAVAAVWDPQAVAAMTTAGLGAEITLDLGGKTAMPSIGREGIPLEVSGTVSALSPGEWVVGGPMFTGTRVSTGPTAVLDTGAVEIVVVSRHHEPWDLGIFETLGIEPANKRYLVLKSRIHYRAAFAPIAKHTITCDGDGVTTSENARLRFERVRRPIYPLDEVAEDG